MTGFYLSRPPKSPKKLPERKKIDLSFGDLVAALISMNPTGIRILQVGAYDGVSSDPIFNVVAESNATLILVEPNPVAMQQLKQTYSKTPHVKFVEAAISTDDNGGVVKLYRFSQTLVEIYPDFGGTSSLSLKHLEDAFERNRHRFAAEEQLANNIIVDRVHSISVEQLLNDINISDLDVLVIDAEGWDWIVLREFLRAGLRPKLILFENRFLLLHDFEAALMELHSLNYILRDFGEDTVAIKVV